MPTVVINILVTSGTILLTSLVKRVLCPKSIRPEWESEEDEECDSDLELEDEEGNDNLGLSAQQCKKLVPLISDFLIKADAAKIDEISDVQERAKKTVDLIGELLEKLKETENCGDDCDCEEEEDDEDLEEADDDDVDDGEREHVSVRWVNKDDKPENDTEDHELIAEVRKQQDQPVENVGDEAFKSMMIKLVTKLKTFGNDPPKAEELVPVIATFIDDVDKSDIKPEFHKKLVEVLAKIPGMSDILSGKTSTTTPEEEVLTKVLDELQQK